MARAPSAKVKQAEQMYHSGHKLIEIARQLELPEGTVRRWKCTYKWDGERSEKKTSVRKEKKPTAKEVGQVLDNPDLTDKQRLFCLYYVKSFNATKAYQKAYGCKYEIARSIAYRQLQKESVRKEIQRLKQERINREFLTEEDIFQKYLDIAFADMTDFIEFGTEEVPVMAVYGPVEVKDEDTGKKKILTQTENVMRFRKSDEVDGTLINEVRNGRNGASIKLADRMKALEWLTSHMDLATEEQRAKIDQIRAQTDKLTGNNQEIEDLSEIEGDIYGE